MYTLLSSQIHEVPLHSYMRILSGEFKNRSIEVPKQAQTRPTSSKMRAQLFNICQTLVEECRFLDICAGSGAMGLEAVSRGASSVVFIDHDADAVRTIKKNIDLLEIETSCRVVFSDALMALKKIEKEIREGKSNPFDIIFFDPPYSKKEDSASFTFVREVVSLIGGLDSSLLQKNGLFFLEESRFCPVETFSTPSLQLLSKRGTGDSCLYEFQGK